MKRTEQQLLPAVDLLTLKRNPQYLTPAQMDSLKKSIERDGFCVPILVRPVKGGKYEIVSGNHRYMAAVELGVAQIPCVVAKMSDREARRLAVNLNMIHGEPPVEMLAPFLAEFSAEELADIHLEESLQADLMNFDDALASALAGMKPPESLDTASQKHRMKPCKCPKCGSSHSAGAEKKQ